MNWVWVEWLTIYHAVFSITIPITLVELAYQERKNERWVGNKRVAGLVVLLGGLTAFGFLFLTDYRPPLPQYFLSVTLVIFLTLLAWRIPFNAGKNGRVQVLKPGRLALIGFSAALALFLLFGAGPYVVSQPPILMILGIGLVFTLFGFMKRYDWNEQTLYHKFALVAGTVAFLIALTPLQEQC